MDLIVSGRDELVNIIEEVVGLVFGQLEFKLQTPKTKNRLTIMEAVEFLAENGYNISRSQLYKRTMTNDVPFYRFGGRKILFDPQELLTWAENRCLSASKCDALSVTTLSRSAEKKQKVGGVINKKKNGRL